MRLVHNKTTANAGIVEVTIRTRFRQPLTVFQPDSLLFLILEFLRLYKKN